HVERVRSRGLFAALAATAQFIQAERRERAEQGKTRRERKQQRQHRIAEHGARQRQAEHRIDHAQDDGVARYRLEILPAEPQRGVQVGQADGADNRRGRGIGCGPANWCDIALVGCRHVVSPFRCLPCGGVACQRYKRTVRGNDHDQARREDRKAKLALSRTERPAYSQCREQALTLRCCRSANEMRHSCVIAPAIHWRSAALASTGRPTKVLADRLRLHRPPEKARFSLHTVLEHWEYAMSILGKIMGAIFGSHASASPAGGGAAPAGGAPASSGAPAGTASQAPAAPMGSVDVAAIVDKAAAAKKGEKLEWRTSIVDLMKAL